MINTVGELLDALEAHTREERIKFAVTFHGDSSLPQFEMSFLVPEVSEDLEAPEDEALAATEPQEAGVESNEEAVEEPIAV